MNVSRGMSACGFFGTPGFYTPSHGILGGMTTIATLDELEELMLEEPMCEVDHDDMRTDFPGFPACAITASARLVSCDDVILICRPILEEIGLEPWLCQRCGRACVHPVLL